MNIHLAPDNAPAKLYLGMTLPQVRE